MTYIPDSVRLIISEVAQKHRVAVSEILGEWRDRRVVHARYAAMNEVRRRVVVRGKPPSYSEIGRWFNRDHSTVMYALGALREKPSTALSIRPAEQMAENV